MKIDIDSHSGFCFGVIYAIQMAEDELDQHGSLYCLGDIVHNEVEVKRLTDKGLKIITHKDLEYLHDCKVLIRAHGEPPQTYITALKNNIQLLDASCPVVLKLQHRVKNTYDSMSEDTQIVIYGIDGHAEVKGLMGQTGNKAIVITGEPDLEKIDFSKPIVLFSQTTKSTDKYYAIRDLIMERAMQMGNTNVNAYDTICRQVSNRAPHLEKFSKQYDVVVFVSGQKSSNGKVLYQVCKSNNDRSYFVSGPEDIQKEWFESATSVGVSGATSTPMWLIHDVVNAIKSCVQPALATSQV